MTEMQKSRMPWQGETGFIDREMLMKWIEVFNGPIYYSADPPAMVAAMRQMLTDIGVRDEAIRTEEFTGC